MENQNWNGRNRERRREKRILVLSYHILAVELFIAFVPYRIYKFSVEKPELLSDTRKNKNNERTNLALVSHK